jgi:hypothetical protein
MYGKELLEKGVLWRVGDGKTIRLIKDCWVPDHAMLLKPKVPLPNDLTVSFLIDDEKGEWNKDLIHECFDDVVADKILHIPLCHTPCVDLPAWQHNKSGVYTVKSGYYLTRLNNFHNAQSINEKGENSDQKETMKLWKCLWSIKAPTKMKIVLWRMAHDCLPTGVLLKLKHICNTDVCCFCGQDETIQHIMLKCQYTSAVWRQMKRYFCIRVKFQHFISMKQ